MEYWIPEYVQKEGLNVVDKHANITASEDTLRQLTKKADLVVT